MSKSSFDLQKNLYRAIFKRLKGSCFAVTYWDSETEVYEDGRILPKGEFKFHLLFRKKLSVEEVMSDPALQLGEAYMQGGIDFEGDIKELLRFAVANEKKIDDSAVDKLKKLIESKKKVSRKTEEKGVKYHYDLGNDFFKLWLDDTLSYSCAYFYTPDDPLEKAQLQKIDHVLKKLNLKPGEKLLDIGSGWGWLIIQAAQQYGVKAMGITLSEEQEKETMERIAKADLQDMVKVSRTDYRDLAKSKQKFDKVVSVGMFEHVGKENIPCYFETLDALLAEGGLSLLHTITRHQEGEVNPWLQKYIFPWGYIPSLREVVWELPEHNFYLLDVESLRLHYAMTTGTWAENYEQAIEKVREIHDEQFVRMWRLYLAGCSVSFECSGLDIHQVLFSKGLNNSLPLTREHLYK